MIMHNWSICIIDADYVTSACIVEIVYYGEGVDIADTY